MHSIAEVVFEVGEDVLTHVARWRAGLYYWQYTGRCGGNRYNAAHRHGPINSSHRPRHLAEDPRHRGEARKLGYLVHTRASMAA